MSGDFYCRAFGENIFEVEKPVKKKGIGFDQLPEFIRNSNVYSANNLGKFANIETIPSENAVIDLIEEVTAKDLINIELSLDAFQAYREKNNYLYMLKNILRNFDLSDKDRKKLLEKTAKCALESNDNEFAWKTALYAGRF